MFDYIKNNAPLIAIIISILAILTAILNNYLSNWWRLRKSLVYSIKTNTEIFSVEEEIKDKFQILYNKEVVKSPRLFIIFLSNNGRQPIEKKDFDKDIDFVFSENSSILSAEINSTYPTNLSIRLEKNLNKLSVKPFMLNKGWSFEIKGLANTTDDKIFCDAIISGIDEVKGVDLSAPKRNVSFINVILSIIALIIALLFLMTEDDKNKSIGLALIVLIISYWLHKKSQR